MPLCVYAYTPPGPPAPPFVNLSRMEDGSYRIVVRSELSDGVGIQPVAQMMLSREQATELYRSLQRDLLAKMVADDRPISVAAERANRG